jgi:hypothetical protein
VAVSYEDGNKHLESIKYGEFLYQPSDFQLLIELSFIKLSSLCNLQEFSDSELEFRYDNQRD